MLQPVGDDIVEIVADKESGDLRVYVLDLGLKPVPIGEREIKLAIRFGVGAGRHRARAWARSALLHRQLDVKVNPTKVTVVLKEGGHTHVVLCGYRPGAVIVVGRARP